MNKGSQRGKVSNAKDISKEGTWKWKKAAKRGSQEGREESEEIKERQRKKEKDEAKWKIRGEARKGKASEKLDQR